MVNFTGDRVIPKGVVKLTIIASTYQAQAAKEIYFLMVDFPSKYNVSLGQPTLNKLKAAPSTYHLKVKFPTAHDIGEIREDQVLAREYCQAILALRENHTWMIGKPKPILKPSEASQGVEVVLGDPSKVLKIVSALSASKETKITTFLRENQDFFT